MSKPTIALIGYGRFGRFAAKLLSKDFLLKIYDVKKTEVSSAKNLKFVSLREVCQEKTIIVAVPIGKFESVIKQIKKLVQSGALVIDVCSVKEYPAAVMKKHLPKSIELLSLHTMFGEESANQGLQGLNLVIYPLRINKQRYQQVGQYLKKFKLDIQEMSPLEHDKWAAQSQFITHLLGQVGQALKLKNTPVDTRSFECLSECLRIMSNDTWEIFQDMYQYNRYARKMLKSFVREISKIDKKLSA